MLSWNGHGFFFKNNPPRHGESGGGVRFICLAYPVAGARAPARIVGRLPSNRIQPEENMSYLNI